MNAPLVCYSAFSRLIKAGKGKVTSQVIAIRKRHQESVHLITAVQHMEEGVFSVVSWAEASKEYTVRKTDGCNMKIAN